MKKYEQLAKDIVGHVGGPKNVNSLFHCVTRLRFRLKDDSKADKAVIEKMDGVLSVVVGNGQFQVVIGNAVTDVYDTVLELYSDIKSEGNAEADEQVKPTGNLLTRMFNTMSAIFTPIITALAGAGMIKALLVLCTTYAGMDNQGSTYKILSAAGNSVFYFLPLFLAISSAKTFKVNPFIALAIVGALLEPNFTKLMKANGDMVDFLGLPVVLMGYTGTVIPAILTVWAYSYLERGLRRIVPKNIEIFGLSMLALMIMVPVTVMVIGPLGVAMGNGMGNLINFLSAKTGLVTGAVIGGGWTYLVMMGIHWGVVPIMINNIASLGYDVIRPMIAAATFASAGAALGCFLYAKNQKTKSLAISSLFPALLGGITEPIIYGLSIRFKRPLIAQTIAGAIAGAFMGAMQTKAMVYVFPALTTLPAFIGDTFMFYVIGISLSFFISAGLTYALGFEDEAIEEMPGKVSLAACVKGELFPLNQVNDAAFASKALGDGVAFKPQKGEIIAPAAAKVITAFPTGHAVGLRLTNGAEVLIHVGINTVELDGKYFEMMVKDGDKVRQGDSLIRFDLAAIEAAGYNTTTMMVITNSAGVDKLDYVTNNSEMKNKNVMWLEYKGSCV